MWHDLRSRAAFLNAARILFKIQASMVQQQDTYLVVYLE
jgi:hypothetical protein